MFDGKHKQKYVENRQVVHDLLVLEQPPYDWVVTVAFYAALHLVESVIEFSGAHSTDHFTRRTFMLQNRDLQPISRLYLLLEKESKRSRYDCQPFDQHRAQISIDKLTEIEQYLLAPQP